MREINGLDYLSEKRYKVSVTLGVKALANNIIRNEHSEKIYLSTIDGVQRYLDDAQPVVNVAVTDLLNREDVTELFEVVYCKSRYNNKVVISKYR
jgi:hypothetical protein